MGRFETPAEGETLSVVIPAKDEEETLPLVLRELRAALAALEGYESEVVCVDDHSSDRTAEIARSFGARVVVNRGRPGKGASLRLGFGAAVGEILAMMDADYSHRPEDLASLLARLRGDVGLVVASRALGGSDEYTPVRAFGNAFLTRVLGLCTGCRLQDALNGYKVFRRDVFDAFDYTSVAFEIEIELIANALRRGYRVVEVESHERARAGGRLKSRVVRHGTRFLARILHEGLRGVKPT